MLDPSQHQLPQCVLCRTTARCEGGVDDNTHSVRSSIGHSKQNKADTNLCSALNRDNISETVARGRSLWKSIYTPLDDKLSRKLAQSHPDLAVYIIESAYGALFSDSPSFEKPALVGRVLTSLVAIACLRAQTGTGPQVVSHVFGLRKAFQNDVVAIEDEQYIRGSRWLASDEGSIWLLTMIDNLVETISTGNGGTFAAGPARNSKL